MKTLLIAVSLLLSNLAFSHTQPAHQHMVRQAWNLIKHFNPGYQYTELNNNLGDFQTDGPWTFTSGRVVAGVYREDEEDVIWNYACPPYIWWDYTATHFWKVDDGPNSGYDLNIPDCLNFTCSNIPGTSWSKMEKYRNGGFTFKKTFYDNQGGVSRNVSFTLWNNGNPGGGVISLFSPGGAFGFPAVVGLPKSLLNSFQVRSTL